MKQLVRTSAIGGAILLSLLLMGSLNAQSAPCGTMPDGSIPIACVTVKLAPDTLVGDFVEDGVTIVQQVNSTTFYWFEGTETITPFQVEVKNIKSTEPDFGTLFIYGNTSVTVQGAKGRNKIVPVKPQKTYTHGTLKFTCDIKNAAPSDAVSCHVTIDSAAQADVAAGQAASYVLEPGDRLVLVEINGEQANLFDPASKQQTVKITAGNRVTNLKATFTKKGHLALGLDQAGVVADFYLDGTQVATQTASYDLWVAPGKSHKIEARGFNDPAAGGVYAWKNVSQTVTVGSGKERTIALKLQKQWLKGFLNLKCAINKAKPQDHLACQPSIDGVAVGSIPSGEARQYTLDPGSHRVTVALSPAGVITASPQTFNVAISAGKTANRTVTFTADQPTPTASAPGGNMVTKYGRITKNETWSGTIHVIGDLRVESNAKLTIKPGTTIYVAANSDFANLDTWPSNARAGINDTGAPIDGVEVGEPFRDEPHHVSISIGGTLDAVGTPEQPIVFVSDSSTPGLYDWNFFSIRHGILSYARVENHRSLQAGDGVIISHNVIRNSGEVGAGTISQASPIIEYNQISYSGHELILAYGGAPVIRFNTLGPNPQTIGAGAGGYGISVLNQAFTQITGNTIQGCERSGVLFSGPINPLLDLAAILSGNVFVGNAENIAHHP